MGEVDQLDIDALLGGNTGKDMVQLLRPETRYQDGYLRPGCPRGQRRHRSRHDGLRPVAVRVLSPDPALSLVDEALCIVRVGGEGFQQVGGGRASLPLESLPPGRTP